MKCCGWKGKTRSTSFVKCSLCCFWAHAKSYFCQMPDVILGRNEPWCVSQSARETTDGWFRQVLCQQNSAGSNCETKTWRTNLQATLMTETALACCAQSAHICKKTYKQWDEIRFWVTEISREFVHHMFVHHYVELTVLQSFYFIRKSFWFFDVCFSSHIKLGIYSNNAWDTCESR